MLVHHWLDLRPSKTLSFSPAIPSGCVKDLVQEKTGFPRFRLTLLLEDGKSWEELGKPHEVQAVYNQVATDMAEDLLHLGQKSKWVYSIPRYNYRNMTSTYLHFSLSLYFCFRYSWWRSPWVFPKVLVSKCVCRWDRHFWGMYCQ